MKTVMIGVVSLALGVGGGAYVSGTRVKDEILAVRAQAQADSLAAATANADVGLGTGPGHAEGGVPVALGTDRDAGEDRPPPGPDSANPDPAVGTQSNGGPEGLQAETPREPQVTGGEDSGEVSTQVSVTPRLPPPPPPDSSAIRGAIKLAQIFSAMKPVDAAAVLQEMTDVEVEAILQHMQSRLAGQVLGAFEPERAALLSRVVLKGAAGS